MGQLNPMPLPGNIKPSRGASPADLAALERWAEGIRLPAAYLDFLRASNGYEGSPSEEFYLSIWSTNEVPENNMGYRVAEYEPEMLFFGSTGGGSAYAFDTRGNPMPVLRVDYFAISFEDAEPVADDFEGFLRLLKGASGGESHEPA